MNVDIIKDKIKNLKGEKHNFRFNGSRNQIEEFNGVITSVYPAVFIIETNKKDKIRSFSYNDVITSSLEIIDVKEK